MIFKDLFSGHADDYKRFRPHYPDELFAFLAEKVSPHDIAWDCGTGNGQGAAKLAGYFLSVHATDASHEQIEQAISKPNVHYDVRIAEDSGLPDESVSLITVFQALHWFDTEKFFQEASRVLLPHGVLAVIGYHTVLTGIDIIDKTYNDFCFDFLWEKNAWEMERGSLNGEYKNIVFPFKEIKDIPAFQTEMEWDYEDYLAYLNTWSSVKTYIKLYGENPVETYVIPKIEKHWPDKTEKRTLIFPLIVRCFRK